MAQAGQLVGTNSAPTHYRQFAFTVGRGVNHPHGRVDASSSTERAICSSLYADGKLLTRGMIARIQAHFWRALSEHRDAERAKDMIHAAVSPPTEQAAFDANGGHHIEPRSRYSNSCCFNSAICASFHKLPAGLTEFPPHLILDWGWSSPLPAYRLITPAFDKFVGALTTRRSISHVPLQKSKCGDFSLTYLPTPSCEWS